MEKNLNDLKKAWNIGSKSKEFEWVYMTKAEKEAAKRKKTGPKAIKYAVTASGKMRKTTKKKK